MAERGGTSLDPWLHHYAARTAGLSASEVRALFAVASRPEVVSLAGGMPFVSALPQEFVMSALERTMRNHGAAALQYGSGQGTERLREHILDVMALEGISASIDNVVVTTGSQQAVDLVAKLFLDPGDVVLAEAPSYVGALGVFRSYEAEVVHIEVDDDGLVPEALQARIASVRAEGRRIKFLYTIPNFHNPAGVTLSAARRPEILAICRANDILILEDNPYGLLWFDHAAPDALRSIEEDGVIYLGSFSKTFAAGFRVGWALAPHAIREKLVLASESAILSPSVFSQTVIAEYLDAVDWRAQIDTFRGLYRERRDAMVTALDDFLPDIRHTHPGGGFFVWLDLPEELDSKAMLPRAVKELVAYTPGTAFFADGNGRQNIRLSFCYPSAEQIRVGVRRLATVLSAERELLETFRGTGDLRSRSNDQRTTTPPPDVV
ncbi:MAG TPA: PLP-dependent aminotransferase family protein [Microbacteriaceae bacterium]|nr:PLP-dependent aminotransferase family protein [Microbacteriaceae bacterium]